MQIFPIIHGPRDLAVDATEAAKLRWGMLTPFDEAAVLAYVQSNMLFDCSPRYGAVSICTHPSGTFVAIDIIKAFEHQEPEVYASEVTYRREKMFEPTHDGIYVSKEEVGHLERLGDYEAAGFPAVELTITPEAVRCGVTECAPDEFLKLNRVRMVDITKLWFDADSWDDPEWEQMVNSLLPCERLLARNLHIAQHHVNIGLVNAEPDPAIEVTGKWQVERNAHMYQPDGAAR